MPGLFRDLRQQYGDQITKLIPRLTSPVNVNRGPLIEAERRGQESQRLLEDGALKRILAAVEANYLNAWRTSKGDEAALRERAHIGVNLLDDLVNVMKAEVARGDAAAAQLSKIAHTPT